MRFESLSFSGHAIRRMFERSIDMDAVVSVVREGEVIESYPDDEPYPSYLILGYFGTKPLHVLVASEIDSALGIVVTVYVPDPVLWSEGFRKRKQK